MMNQPKVSVVMGIYNCESTLAQAIDSILAQTYTNWELILCDDGSTDGTYALAQKYKDQYPDQIILLKNERNRKLSYTLNRCLEAATGELIARMDGDDISCRERLERQVEFLKSHPDIQMVGSSIQYFDEAGLDEIRRFAPFPEKKDLMGKREPFCHPTIMARKIVFDTLVGYTDLDWTVRTEDLNLYFRFFHAGFKGANIDETLYQVRVNYASLKRRTLKNRINYIRTLAHGYALLGFPKTKLVKPALVTIGKALVPAYLVMKIRQWQGRGGKKT